MLNCRPASNRDFPRSSRSPGAECGFLVGAQGDARPDTLVYLRIRDVEAIASEFGVQAKDAPWAREIELRDPDGNRLRIGTPTE
ncbi:hypothetical protein GCM10010244_56440 [Streptomyces coeruleorubidus]|nr:hypothetical protein GCM10010244_56440 [Streptomyces bellus]